MMVELTDQDIMMLRLLMARMRDFILRQKVYQEMYGEHYNQCMSEMSDMIKKLSEVLNA